MQLAERMSRLGTETAFDVLAHAKKLEAEGKNVVHLEIGEPDFDTPSHITDAAIAALKEGWTHYGPSAGLPELREAIAEDISRTRNIDVKPSQVVVTPGGKPIMFFLILSLVNEGDEVIYPNPGFPIYESMINFVGAKPVPVPLKEEFDFSLDVNELESLVTDKTKMIILNSPQNPTGGILSRDDLKRIAEISEKRGIFVLADEIYSRMVYNGNFESITRFDPNLERTCILDGFSKTYAMTGWRLGYGVTREDLAAQIAKLMTNSNSCTASFTQKAGVAALKGDQTPSENMIAEFKRRRDFIVEGLNKIPGFSCKTPKGAFYVFPNVKEIGWDTKKLQEYILDNAHVALLSGTAFGKYGEGYLRLSYANSIENIKEALERIDALVRKL